MPSVNSRASAAPSMHASEKDSSELYPFNRLDFQVNDVTDRCKGIKGPLSLFAPYPHEDWYLVNHDYHPVLEDQPPPTEVELERPITPIDEEITQPPNSYNKLAKLVRRRITAKTDSAYLGVDDQKELAAIVMGEVNGVWADFKTQVDDPFLSPEENRELQRRITVHIVTVCGQLFKHYTEKAHILQSRGVFSGPANMSRLKAQLSLDTNKFLNISTIRRYIVNDLRQESKFSPRPSKSHGAQKERVPEAKIPGISYKGLIAASRPKSKTKKFECTTPSAEIKEMTNNMPMLDTARLETILRDIDPQQRSTLGVDELMFADHEFQQVSKGEQIPSPRPTDRMHKDDVPIHRLRSQSVPRLHDLETLSEVMGLQTERHSAISLTDESALCVDRKSEPETSGPVPGTREYAATDLKKLLRKKEEVEAGAEEEEDLAPLLQALTRGKQHDNCMATIDKQLQDLEKREQDRIESEKVVLVKETQPQPATVSTKLPNKMVVRTSDIRVSERACLSSITLKKHETVYNDIIDEIDPATVKALDSNLFLGDEITEVYSEIMKTVPTDHLLLENDPLIVPAADAIDLTAVLASATLAKRPSERIINPKLHQQSSPPWGHANVNEWSKTPESPPKDVKGRALIIPMTPRGDGRAENDFFGEGYKALHPSSVVEVHEVMARSYASWLQWWKNTLNTDDYMKYVSTQETDFLGVVFHFYNSDDEDDDNRENSAQKEKRSKQLIEEEKAKQMEEMKNAKAEFKEGFWNVNSVLLGGLGNDPLLLDVTEDKDKTLAVDDDAHPTKMGKNRTHLVSRKMLRTQGSGLCPLGDGFKSREVMFTPRSSRPGTKISSPRSPVKSEVELSSPQQKLERVWTLLQMPDKQRLDMAIKYSSDQHYAQLQDAIYSWEKVTEMILMREDLVGKLEKFERLASDPNRFFEKGFRGSSVARLEEAKIRSAYYKKIERLDTEIRDVLEDVSRDFKDTVTFQGRPYLDKIQWDRTEMLYWLQEERKQQAIDYESKIKHLPPLPMKMAHLGAANSVAASVQ